MNDLTRALLEAAWQDLKPNRQTLAALKCEVGTDWIIWRNHQIEDWAVKILPYIQRRPASDFYWGTPKGDFFYGWINEHGFYSWELPVCDGEDDDFVYGTIAHVLAIMAWLTFEEGGTAHPQVAFGSSGCWPHLDYTEAEIEDFFNFKTKYPCGMNYAPRPRKAKAEAKVEGTQLTMF